MVFVEQLIKEETVITIMQSYIEANCLNDMMNFQHQIVNTCVENELRRIIKGLLGEIYYAHLSTLFLENFMTNAVRDIAKQALKSEQQQEAQSIAQKCSWNIEGEVVQTLLLEIGAELICDICEKELFRQLFKDGLVFIQSQSMLASDLIEAELENQLQELVVENLMEQNCINRITENMLQTFITTDLVCSKYRNDFLENQVASFTLLLCTHEVLTSQLANDYLSKVLADFALELAFEVVVEEVFQPRISSMLLRDQVQKFDIKVTQSQQRQRERVNHQVAEELYVSLVYAEVRSLSKKVVEDEIYLRMCMEELVKSQVRQSIRYICDMEILAELLYDDLVASQILDTFEEVEDSVIEDIEQNQEDFTRGYVEQLETSLIRQAVIDIACEQTTDIVKDVISLELIECTLDDELIEKSIHSELIDSVISEELQSLSREMLAIEKSNNLMKRQREEARQKQFKAQLDKDAEQILQSILAGTLQSITTGHTIGAYVPHSVQRDICESGVRTVTKQTTLESVALTIETDEMLESVEKKMIREILAQYQGEEERARLSAQRKSIPQEPKLEERAKVERHFKQKSSVLINLAEISAKPLQPVQRTMHISEEDPALVMCMSTLVNKVTKQFTRDILTSIVLPHKIYKRIMNRIVRKSTYAAIQHAVEIVYRIEEDTINMADRVLDSFVESQIREMVMLYPNNQQRRSHTILIDSSNDKLSRKLQQQQQLQNQKTPTHDAYYGGRASPLSPMTALNGPPNPSSAQNPYDNKTPDQRHIQQEDQPILSVPERTRNASNMMQPITAINNILRTGQPQHQQNFMFISEEDLMITQEPRLTSQKVPSSYSITRQINPQSHTNQRYNSCGGNERGFGESSSHLRGDNNGSLDDEMGYIEQLSRDHMEENRGKQVPMTTQMYEAKNAAGLSQGYRTIGLKENGSRLGGGQMFMTTQPIALNNQFATFNHHTGSPNAHNNQQFASTFASAQYNALGNMNHLPLQASRQTPVVNMAKLSEAYHTTIDDRNDKRVMQLLEQKKSKQVSGKQTQQSKALIKQKNSIQMLKSRIDEGLGSSPEEIMDDFAEANSNPQKYSGREEIEPKQGFKFVEAKASNQSYRSQTAIQGKLGRGSREGEKSSLVQMTSNEESQFLLAKHGATFQPTLNQFDNMSASLSSQFSGKNNTMQRASNNPQGEYGLGANKSAGVSLGGMGQAKSPQHSRYFNGQIPQFFAPPSQQDGNVKMGSQTPSHYASVKTSQHIVSGPSGRSTSSNKRAHIDLRALQGSSTSSGKAKQLISGSASRNDNKSHSQSRSNASQAKSAASQQEQAINSQLQKLVVQLRSRVADCKAKISQYSPGKSSGNGPSTSVLMTQLASDVLHSLGEQILTVKQPPAHKLIEMDLQYVLGLESQDPEDVITANAHCREQLFAIDKKVKELVSKLQQNQSLMGKQEFQQCMLQANQLAMLNYQKLTCMMNGNTSEVKPMPQQSLVKPNQPTTASRITQEVPFHQRSVNTQLKNASKNAAHISLKPQTRPVIPLTAVVSGANWVSGGVSGGGNTPGSRGSKQLKGFL